MASKTILRSYIDGYADSLEMVSSDMKRRLAEELDRIDSNCVAQGEVFRLVHCGVGDAAVFHGWCSALEGA